MNDFEWAIGVKPAIEHDRTKPFIVRNFDPRLIYGLYPKFQEIYGKGYMDVNTRYGTTTSMHTQTGVYGCNLFGNKNIDRCRVNISITSIQRSMGIDTGWDMVNNDGTDYYHTSDEKDYIVYTYEEFLNLVF